MILVLSGGLTLNGKGDLTMGDEFDDILDDLNPDGFDDDEFLEYDDVANIDHDEEIAEWENDAYYDDDVTSEDWASEEDLDRQASKLSDLWCGQCRYFDKCRVDRDVVSDDIACDEFRMKRKAHK